MVLGGCKILYFTLLWRSAKVSDSRVAIRLTSDQYCLFLFFLYCCWFVVYWVSPCVRSKVYPLQHRDFLACTDITKCNFVLDSMFLFVFKQFCLWCSYLLSKNSGYSCESQCVLSRNILYTFCLFWTPENIYRWHLLMNGLWGLGLIDCPNWLYSANENNKILKFSMSPNVLPHFLINNLWTVATVLMCFY